MIYSVEVKKKLDMILKAFENYINQQSYFDIVYSQKIGYVWIPAGHPRDTGIELLNTPEKMLDVLFNEIINDVTAEYAKQNNTVNLSPLSNEQEAEVRRRIVTLLESLTKDKDCYLQFLDRYLKAYHENNGLIEKSDAL